jgi:hypothetical protein
MQTEAAEMTLMPVEEGARAVVECLFMGWALDDKVVTWEELQRCAW